MGVSDENECTRRGDGARRHKRPSFFRKLGDRIRRAFHRKPRGHRAQIDERFSRSTGDLTSNSPDSKKKSADVFSPSGGRRELPGSSLSAEDRAVSEGHILSACDSRNQPSEFLCPKAAFLSSDFRNELNSKLRLPPGTGFKTAGSSGSLASDDSTFFNPVVGSDERLSLGDTPNTPDSGVAVKSSFLPSPSLACTQHKLAVSKQRNRRPPTLFGASTPVQEPQNRTLLDSSCANFFNTSGLSLSGAHLTRLDFISEEENELQSSTPQTPMLASQISRSELVVPPCGASGETADKLRSQAETTAAINTIPLPESIDSTIEAEPVHSFFPQDSGGLDTSTSQPPFIHRNSVNLHSTHKRTLSDNEDDRDSSHSQESPISRPTLRPVSMYVGTSTVSSSTPNGDTRRVSPLHPRKRLQTTDCYMGVGVSNNECRTDDADVVSKLSDAAESEIHEDEPELKSVADRASVFGAVLHSPKPGPPPPPDPAQVRRRNMEQIEATANNRASRVFSLVKNFEQSC